AGVVGTGRGREASPAGVAGDKCVSRCVDGDLIDAIIRGAAEKGRINENRINNQGVIVIVGAERKSNDMRIVEHIPRVDSLPLSCDFLIDVWLLQNHLAPRGRKP